MKGWMAAAAALMALLTGCVTTPQQDGATSPATPPPSDGHRFGAPPSIGNRTFDPFSTTMELVKCRDYFADLRYREEDVRRNVPPGYEPIGFASDRMPQVGLRVLSCQSATLDNDTVISPFALSSSTVAVSVNNTLRNSISGHAYAFEYFFSNETVRAMYAAAGFKALLAKIGLVEESSGTEATVEVDGNLWYQATFGPAHDQGFMDGEKGRSHHQADGRPIWDDREAFANQNLELRTVVFESHAGVLHDMRPTIASLNAGISTPRGISETHRIGGF